MWTREKPLTSLYEWAQEIGLNPFIVAQISQPASALSIRGDCNTPFFQTAAQGSLSLSRDNVADCLIEAENLIAGMMFTHPAPKFESYPVQYPRDSNLQYPQLWRGNSDRLRPIHLNYGNIISLGVYEEALIDADVTLTFSDPYSDGFDTVFSLTVTVPTGTTYDEIVCYFSDADSFDLPHDELEVRPLKVTISGTTATITGHVTQIVRLNNYLKMNPSALNATDSIYVETLDVYRKTIDESQAGTLIWNNLYCPNPPCSYTTTSACFQATDFKQGFITPVPADWNIDTEAFAFAYPDRWIAPNSVQVNVISGIPRDESGKVRAIWRKAVCLLATALLPQEKSCGCMQADNILYTYRSLPVNEQGNYEVDPSILGLISKAFGTANRGAIQAYTMLSTNENLPIFRSAYA